jgi:hypothetical protein
MQVGVQKMNTDEPLVEASIVGKMKSKRRSYMRFLISTTAVNRRWWYGFRSKGGMICTQALLAQLERSCGYRKETARWHYHQADY